MKFMYVPAGPYNLGQIIVVNGKEVRVGGKSYSGKNLEASYVETGERILLILTDAAPIVEITPRHLNGE